VYRSYLALLLSLSSCLTAAVNGTSASTSPDITVIVVVDQMAYQYMPRIRPYLHSGLKNLFDQGIEYTNAYFPHGTTATGTGHAGLSTGTYACTHGIIGNRWFDKAGNPVHCDQAFGDNAAIFNGHPGKHSYPKSAQQLLADTISDQFVLANPKNHTVYSISLKSRAAIMTAGNLGRAIWFDSHTHQFTSSHAYFKNFPAWIAQKNMLLHTNGQNYHWTSCFPLDNPAYSSVLPSTYSYVEENVPRINQTIPAQPAVKTERRERYSGDPYDAFLLTPAANQMVLDLATDCLHTELAENKEKRIILWVCLSSLDKLGHFYGPHSFEIVDMLYHLDNQLGAFMAQIKTRFNQKETLFILTADHGMAPIPEVLNDLGYAPACRIPMHKHMKTLNDQIAARFGVNDLIRAYKSPQLFFDMEQFGILPAPTRFAIEKMVKDFLHQQPGVKNVWTFKELEKTPCYPSEAVDFLKKQLFQGRSGHITILPEPYCIDSDWHYGTDHRTPYEYNTHVPLTFWWPSRLKASKISTKVWALQLANSLAALLGVDKPSACPFEALPGLEEAISQPNQQEMPVDQVFDQGNFQAIH